MITLHIHRLQSPVTVLGPGSRAVIWVQGCDIRCRGCLAPYIQNLDDGTVMGVDEVSQWVLDQENIEGVTVSGGEPTLQSEGLVAVIDALREHQNLSIVCYTGRTIEYLRESRDRNVLDLLDRIDLLIDGPYVRRKHADLLWRGSSNQRLIPLTDRYRGLVNQLTPEKDKSAGLEFTGSATMLYYAGVPADPNFMSKLKCEMDRIRQTGM